MTAAETTEKTSHDDTGNKMVEDDDDDDDDELDEKNIMDASDIIHSMRSAMEQQLRNLEPPMPFFTKPKQRQHWGDVQETPRKEWGDIFFDLFYVAGAYNLGTLLRESPTPRGLFYFAAVFFPLLSLWQYKMYFDARFYTLNDMWHNFYDVCTLVTLASAVLHIRPVSLLSDPEHANDLFIFCASVSVGMILIMGRSAEVIFWGEEAAVRSGKREVCMYGSMTLFFAAAAIHAGVVYYTQEDERDDDHDSSAYYGDDSSQFGDTNSSDYNATTSVVDGDHHFRFLAGAAYDDAGAYGESEKNNHSGDVAMGLLLCGYCFNHILWFMHMISVSPRLDGGDFRRSTVPMNIDYAIHRYGEWTMLMLGETVLSLLIVGVKEEPDYYKTFYSGIISISLLEYMHFRSQPHHADEHAMRRKKERGYAYLLLLQLYSAALIILGASYKMLLYEFNYSDDYGTDEYASEADAHRRMLFAPPSRTVLHRWLAGGGGGALQFDSEDRQQRTAHLFCGSLAAVFLLSDLLIVVHKGFKEHMDKCKRNHTSKAAKLLGLPLLLVRIGLIAFMASLSQYTTDGTIIAFVGLMCILVELMLRVVGTSLFKEENEEDKVYQEMLHNGIQTD